MTTTATGPVTRTVSVRGGLFQVELLEAGAGPPLLYFHGIAGLEWDGAIERLAQQHRVLAPHTPGYGESSGSERLSDVHDLLYFYLDLYQGEPRVKP